MSRRFRKGYKPGARDYGLRGAVRMSALRSEKGMVLVLTLMILVLITAVVVEFSYNVYTTSSSLYNWEVSQRLSLAALSGVTLAVKTASDNNALYDYTYPGRIDVPVPPMLSGFEGSVIITVEDENSRFNLNSLVEPYGTVKDEEYKTFQRLLRNLNLDDTIADKVADWIDKDSAPRLPGSEDNAKNAYIDDTGELFQLEGIDRKSIESLRPYVTVYGLRQFPQKVNINTAPIPVIMSLAEGISKELAERIIAYRDLSPFVEDRIDISKVAGFEGTLRTSVTNMVKAKSENFRIRSTAEENGIKRIIECVVEINGGSRIVKYWSEM